MEQDPNAPPQAKRVGKASNAGGKLIYRTRVSYLLIFSDIARSINLQIDIVNQLHLHLRMQP